MPEDLVIQEMEKLDLDFTDEINLKILAKNLDVSSMAMSYRISDLEIF